MIEKQDSRTEKRRLGDIGENIACEFLKRRGFEILDRNYLRKWGELDIVAKKGRVIHFVEVKTVRLNEIQAGQVSHEMLGRGVTHGTSDSYRPEDNLHPWKLKRLSRVMQTYLLDKKLDSDFQLDIITVKMDMKTRQARVEIIENVVI